jgi:multiple sugar transport system ATP-binding protein
MNLHTVDVTSDAAGSGLTAPGLQATVPTPTAPARAQVGWRPTDATIEPWSGDPPRGPGLRLTGRVDVVEFTGDAVVVHGLVHEAPGPGDEARWTVVVPARQPAPAVGDRVTVHVPADRLHLFDAEDGRRLGA